MDYSRFDVEDFVSDISFQEFCLGTDEKSVNFWTQWINEHPDKKKIVKQAKALYYTLNGNITDENFRKDYQEFKEASSKLKTDLGSPFYAEQEAPRLRPRRTMLIGLSGVAASMLVVLSFYLFKYRQKNNDAAAPEVAYVSPAGKKMSLQLPDGTRVILNGGSSLTILNGFNKNKRDVALDGEGYFVVTHNPEKPFTVHTSKINVRDIGTEFNIKAYRSDKTTEASLIKGAIEIITSNKKGIILSPNKKFVLLNNAAKLKQAGKNYKNNLNYQIKNLATNVLNNSNLVETDWTQNKLTFYDQPLEDIMLQMERWYGIKISIRNPQLSSNHFTATFENKDITEVLRSLQLSGNFNYRREGDEIIIY